MKISFLLLLVLFSGNANAQDAIVWFHTDFPPISIINGPDAGKGVADQWEHYLAAHLPNFRHEKLVSNVARQHEEMKHRDNVCFRTFIKTPEREKFLLFSDRIADFLPNGFITLKSNQEKLAPFLNQKGELQLADLLETGTFKIAVAAGRSFGPKIDAVLASAKEKTNVIVPFASSDIFYTGLVQLARRHEIEGVIGYAVELSYSAKRLNLAPESFLFLPVAEDISLVPIHISCTKSPAGEKIIGRINQAIQAGGGDYATATYRAWLPPESRDYYDRLRKALPKRRSAQK